MADGTTEASEANSQEGEMNPKVKEAFELAAKQLGLTIKFQGTYVFLDKECDAKTKDTIKLQAQECGVSSTPPATPPANEEPLEEPKKRPLVGDKIPGTRWTYGTFMCNQYCAGGKTKQQWLDTMPKAHLRTLESTAQKLEKFLQSTGLSGTVTSGYRCAPGPNGTTSHNNGNAVDLAPSGNPKQAFLKVMEAYKSGSLSGNQFIYELKKGSREAGAIIHFDFGPTVSAKTGLLVGGQGRGAPYYNVSDPVSLEAVITQRLKDF